MWVKSVCFLFILIDNGFCNKWELLFLGTGACYPSPRHALSSTMLRIGNGEVFLFDAGEGTQLQILKSTIKPTKISKIFITHLHGDHLFGLPGLMATIMAHTIQNTTNDLNRKVKKEKPPPVINIYGPQGIRNYLIHTHLIADGGYTAYFKVHELKVHLEDMKTWPLEIHLIEHVLKNITTKFIGKDIYSKDKVWNLYSDGSISIKASLIKHKTVTFGYVISEADTTGKLNAKKLKEFGVEPGPCYKLIKSGKSFKAKDGRIIEASEVLGPSIRGRKVTILGDTMNPFAIRSLAMHSDVLVHEATFQNSDIGKAVLSQHSTPFMAAKFAKKILAKTLVLNHFSQRYAPTEERFFLNLPYRRSHYTLKHFKHTKNLTSSAFYKMNQKVSLLETEAREALKQMDYHCEVKTAREFMKIIVKRNVKKELRTKNFFKKINAHRTLKYKNF